MAEQMNKQDAIEMLEIFRNDYTREGSAICRAIDIAIDALRQHTIEPEESTIKSEVRLIDANALHAKIYEDSERSYGASANIAQVLLRIETAPTIEAKPVRYGRWIEKPPYSDETVKGLEFQIVCSECDAQNSSITFDENCVPIAKTFYRTRYCPNCGSRMDGGADNVAD